MQAVCAWTNHEEKVYNISKWGWIYLVQQGSIIVNTKTSIDCGGLLFDIGVGYSVQVGIKVNGRILFDIGGSLKMNAQAAGFAEERIGKWVGVVKI